MPLSCLENDLLIETLSGSCLEHQKGQTGQKVHNVFSPDFQGTFWVFVVNLLDHCSNGRLLRLGMQCHTYSLDFINEGPGSLIFFIFQLRLLFTPDCKSCLTTDNQEVNKDFPTCTRFFSTISSPLQKLTKLSFRLLFQNPSLFRSSTMALGPLSRRLPPPPHFALCRRCCSRSSWFCPLSVSSGHHRHPRGDAQLKQQQQ